ncbi:MAG: Wzt carbohydrate-binding domain-containing protein [Bryobacterales bacterium]
MALRFERVRCKIDDLEIAADFSLTPGAIVGVTGPDPGELQLLDGPCLRAIPPDQGEVERETMFVAGPSFLSGDPESVCWWVNAALASEAAVLAIGPAFALAAPGFRIAALRELHAIAREGALVLLVSQDLDMLERHCDETIVIENGVIIDRGDPRATLGAYRKRIAAELREAETDPPEEIARHGDGRASIVSFELLGADGEPTASLETGEQATLVARVQFDDAIEDPVFGILIRNRVGVSVYGTNTELENVHFGPVEEGQEVELRFQFACALCPQDYTVTIASHDPDGTAHDWLEEALLFQVTDTRFTEGVANLRAKVEVRA